MSVQRVPQNYSIETICPLVVNPTESIFAYQTASTVQVNHNVNSQFSSCFPNDYAYLQVYTAESANKCCSNNALRKSSSGNMMGY
jgi:hypothetical protein